MTGRDPELTAAVELRNALNQLQVYEAIAVATNDANAMLDAMLGASDPEAAQRALKQRYGFSDIQAAAVMDVQFRRVTAIERQKIEQRRQELAERVRVLEAEVGGL